MPGYDNSGHNCLHSKVVEYPEGMWCVLQWEEDFGKKSSFAKYVLAAIIVLFYIPVSVLLNG